MLGNIEKIDNNMIFVKLGIDINTVQNLLNLYVLMQDNAGSFVGEIINVDKTQIQIRLLGELVNNNLVFGFMKKPSFNAKINIIAENYIETLIGNKTTENNSLEIGRSPYYKNVKIFANINSLFGSHFAIFGSSGSGKSCGFSRIIQNLISKKITSNMHLMIFDAYGEYEQAFNNFPNPNFNFKMYSTDPNSMEPICLPPWLLDTDDYAILLEANKNFQVSIIEKALRNISLFKQDATQAMKYKNSIIAGAILDIIASGRPAPQIRDQVFSALAKFNTEELNLNTTISEPGYTRTMKQCFIIDENNKINAIELVTTFLQKFLLDNVASNLPDGSIPFTLEDLYDALEFALIAEGIWKSEKVFDDLNIIKVRLSSLINSEKKRFFAYPDYVTKAQYIERLTHTALGKPAQIVNFNIKDTDDRFAKSLVKVYSKMFFNYAKGLTEKASCPFNIILEEAHRYVQKDNDIELLGYNIFERICKEGRKYGVLLSLISQRPCELSDTCLSQCNNFIIFKLTHPLDLDYIGRTIPNMSDEILEKIKTVQPGNCMAFGTGFKIPSMIKLDMPNPMPNSDSCEFSKLWFE